MTVEFNGLEDCIQVVPASVASLIVTAEATGVLRNTWALQPVIEAPQEVG